MSEEHPIHIIESHTTWLRHVQSVDLNHEDNYGRMDMSNAWNVRGVRFRFGYLVMPSVFDAVLSSAFHFSVSCEPKTEEGKIWSCPARISFWIYTRDDTGVEHIYHRKKDIRTEFNKDDKLHNYTCAQLRLQELFAYYPSRSFLIRMEIVVDPPCGVMSCLPYNGALMFSGSRTLAVNKELLATHSDMFKENFGPDVHIFNMDVADAVSGGIEHFKVLYELLEHGTSSELNEINITGILQLASFFKIFKVEAICSTWINSRHSGLSIPQKVLLFDSIGASASKYFAIKNTPKTEFGNNPARYVRTLHSAKQLSYDQINEMRKIADAEL